MYFKNNQCKGRGCGCEVGGVQGMCPHKIYLGTCTCILKMINAREGGVGVKKGGARDVST